MIVIPLKRMPNQRVTFNNNQNRWVVEIKVAIDSMICNLYLNEKLIIAGERVVAGVPVIAYGYLVVNGNFGIITENDDEPWWQEFESSQQLVFWND